MRIGIVSTASQAGGGYYQYARLLVRTLASSELRHDEVVVLVGEDDYSPIQELQLPVFKLPGVEGRSGWQKRLLSIAPIQTAASFTGNAMARFRFHDVDSIRHRPELTDRFRHMGLEFLWYPAPSTLAFEAKTPAVVSVHDLQHRLNPQFPEVGRPREWNQREYLFRNIARFAILIVADSEVGKADLVEAYEPHGLTEDRVAVLPYVPYLPSDSKRNWSREALERFLNGYRVQEPYFFYPAQYWPHKNHEGVINALGHLRRQHELRPQLVFSGSANDAIRRKTLRKLKRLGNSLGVADQLRYLGYVPDKDLVPLYKGAVALVMPTFFGPSNIPPLEAWSLDCPVLTSDIRGVREQMGDAAILVNPNDPMAIADGMFRLLTDPGLRAELRTRGNHRLTDLTLGGFRDGALAILNMAKERVELLNLRESD